MTNQLIDLTNPEFLASPFDITRQPNLLLAFGRSIHFCLGAPLTRAEGRIAFGMLLHEFPNLELVANTPDWGANTFMRGLNSLPVQW